MPCCEVLKHAVFARREREGCATAGYLAVIFQTFYANPPLSEGGAFAGCTALVEARSQGRTILILATVCAVRKCREFGGWLLF